MRRPVENRWVPEDAEAPAGMVADDDLARLAAGLARISRIRHGDDPLTV